MNNATSRNIRRYKKTRALAARATTKGESTAAFAAAKRLWARGVCASPEYNPLKADDGSWLCAFYWEIVEVMDSFWNDSADCYRSGVDTTELCWALECLDHKQLSRAADHYENIRAAGYRNGCYYGSASLKKLNIMIWVLNRAASVSLSYESGAAA